ncbi:1,4-dihydroxy-2-naphthoate polyprenyltransferase [Halapricum desulfuricans]|uniref:1,4-dihydroxy-2-naphthoate octaprenyltransferase n=1 Tax=Halapricum desulfuricans TaxID=2841257 RepID=A0A897NMF7_9EURY|nr:1,4-dihydroxy-2-naphthoate polyprenyltransferase [Halapricum desulfuricans]QSG13947.1 1,4-dihydroxy-2-naphthoate octaprenyltransferase [Halapricum desulfuricans]
MSTADVSRRKAWLMAARPQTLPAGTAPVVVGVGLAIHAGVFALLPALSALVGALLIQIGTNFANDYYDAVKGADTEDREGFTRVTAGGLIEPERVKQAMIATYGLAVLVGVYLVAIGGVPILVVGLSSIVAGVLYTGGPYPYGYRGLGDLFVFVYFGVIAVTGTYYVQAVENMAAVGLFPLGLPTGSVTVDAVVASLAAAALSTCVLVVNNIRDIETDRETGKRTLAVILGYRGARAEYLLLMGMGYTVPVIFALEPEYGLPALAPLLSLPLAARVTKTVLTETSGEALNPALESTGQAMIAHALLFAVGLAA